MRRRPWPIILLALAHILAPLANVIYSAWLMHRPLHFYLIYMFAHGRWHENAARFIGSPIAGVAIYKTNKWSYPIFLVTMAWMLYSNLLTWQEYPEYFGLPSLVFTFVLNLTIVTYFLIPEVRTVYFDPRLRWWETQPRYDVILPVKLSSGEAQGEGVIQNLSEGGAFVRSEMILLADNEVDLRFDKDGQPFAARAKVVYARRVSPSGYGLQIVHTDETRATFKKLVREVKASGAKERIGNAKVWEEFYAWVKMLFKTGKGLIPGETERRPPTQT